MYHCFEPANILSDPVDWTVKSYYLSDICPPKKAMKPQARCRGDVQMSLKESK